MNFSINRNSDRISGTINSEKYNIPYSKEVWNNLHEFQEYLNEVNDYDTFEDMVKDIKEYIYGQNHETALIANEKGIFFAKDGQAYLKSGDLISNTPIPATLVSKIVQAMQEDTPIEPFLKAWTRFLRNPNFTEDKARLFGEYLTAKFVDEEEKQKFIELGYSEEKAKELSTYNEVSITKAGLIQTYKYVNYAGSDTVHPENAEDLAFLPPIMGDRGDPLLVNNELTHYVRVGHIHELPSWDQVNCNDYESCVKGAHVGTQTYIQGYGGKTSFLMNCFVSPSDIGAFVTHKGTADEGALRVKRYYTHSINITPNKNIYHESTFLDKLDEEWEEERALAIKEANDRIQELNDVKKELKLL